MRSTGSVEIIREIREKLLQSREHLSSKFMVDGRATSYLSQHTQLVDEALRKLWLHSEIPAEFCLVAVGGYGRGELFPFSDVDVLVLQPEFPSDTIRGKLERLISGLWDIGLDVGHSVRTYQECLDEAATDITVQTSLIESRLICGPPSSIKMLSAGIENQLDKHHFYLAKKLEQEQRHAKYLDSPFSLEPNIKESPGGLRDLQAILWIGKACNIARSWSGFSRSAFVTRSESSALIRNERFLQKLRIHVHLAAGRREERLLFEYQGKIASTLGFRDRRYRRASEDLMQRYYRTAKAITQLNSILLQNIALSLSPEKPDTIRTIERGFVATKEFLGTSDATEFEKHPTSILRSILVLQRDASLKDMTAPTLRALWRSRNLIDAQFRANQLNRDLFLQILQQPRGLVHALRRMNQYSLLGRYLPSFGRVVGQMQHDLFHVFTVDQHILTVVRNLRRFTMDEFAHEFPLCSRLMAGFDRHWILYVAALFHDIAKGRGGDHSALGAKEVRLFCTDHQILPDDAKLVIFLVSNHLTMSAVAQKQDLSDPAVIDGFAAAVGDERSLVGLYLLTVADIRGTSPKVWNAWKAKLLEDLFHLTQRKLSGDAPRMEEGIQNKLNEARRLLRLYALPENAETNLWKQLDIPYFLRHDASEIAWQTRVLYARTSHDVPVIRARLSPAGEGLQVLIYVRDQQMLFARICGFFESIAFNIVDAKIHTTRHGYALDTFQVMGLHKAGNYRDMIQAIEHDLQEQIVMGLALRAPGKGRISRRLRNFPITPEVTLQPDASGTYFVLTIVAGDRPGLLYSIAMILGKFSIRLHTSKIVTLGDRAEDTFLVSGRSLESPSSMLQFERELLSVLNF